MKNVSFCIDDNTYNNILNYAKKNDLEFEKVIQTYFFCGYYGYSFNFCYAYTNTLKGDL